MTKKREKMKTITIANQKGGTGKTTTALATAHGLKQKSSRILFVDLDPQQNATSVLAGNPEGLTSLDVLQREATIAEAVIHAEGVDLLAASQQGAIAEKLIEGIGAEYRLKEALEDVKGEYDYCIIDTPPAVNVLTANALTAAQFAVIPAQADVFSLQGIGQLAQSIGVIRQYSNPELTIAGILLTRFNARTTLSRDIQEAAQQAAAALGSKVFSATIREGIAIKEAQAVGKSIYDYAPSANVTGDLKAYINELKKVLKNG